MTARYPPKVTSSATFVVGIASTIESSAKAGAVIAATGIAPAVIFPTFLATTNCNAIASV